MKMPSIALAVSAAILLLTAASASSDSMPYPEGYRTWRHVKSGVNDPAQPQKFGRRAGMYHIYANELALQGYRAGRFPDGSVIVYEMHHTTVTNGVTQPGKTLFIDVMRKDSSRFAETRGWDYETFEADGKNTRNVSPTGGQKKCHVCHETQGDHGYVFSRYSE